MSEVDLQKAQRELARWRILVTVNAGRPLPVSEQLILTTLQDTQLPFTPSELRRELDYLEDRKLITILGRGMGPVWAVDLTHYGVDLVEYTVECFPGIARPKKWW